MNISAAAVELFTRRQEKRRGERLALTERPQSIDDALNIQDHVSALMKEKAGQAIAGWKCLLPPENSLVVGPIYADSITEQSSLTLIPQNGCAAIEPEIAFVFDKSLPTRATPYEPEEVFAAIGDVRMALELIGSRYTDAQGYEFPELLADCLFNQGVYLGPKIKSAPSELLINASFQTDVISGRHPNNDVRAPLVWLANFLNSRACGIEAGQVVITGSFAGVLNAPLSEDITLEYQGLGSMTVRAEEFK